MIKNHATAVNPVCWEIQDTGGYVSRYPNILTRSLPTSRRPSARHLHHLSGSVPEIASRPAVPDRDFVEETGKTNLVWGGSSSVGATMIQLAFASGLTVATTASPQNHDFVKSLGATHVFDHTKDNVIGDIVSVLKGSEVVGVYDAIALERTFKAGREVLSELGGGKLVSVLPPPEKGLPDKVNGVGLFAITIGKEQKEVSNAVWRKYAPKALAEGRLQAKPDPIRVILDMAKSL